MGSKWEKCELCVDVIYDPDSDGRMLHVRVMGNEGEWIGFAYPKKLLRGWRELKWPTKVEFLWKDGFEVKIVNHVCSDVDKHLEGRVAWSDLFNEATRILGGGEEDEAVRPASGSLAEAMEGVDWGYLSDSEDTPSCATDRRSGVFEGYVEDVDPVYVSNGDAEQAEPASIAGRGVDWGYLSDADPLG